MLLGLSLHQLQISHYKGDPVTPFTSSCCYSLGETNEAGELLGDICKQHDLLVTNVVSTLFQKALYVDCPDQKTRNQIDYFVTRRRRKKSLIIVAAQALRIITCIIVLYVLKADLQWMVVFEQRILKLRQRLLSYVEQQRT